jgi:ferredoxin
VAAVEEIARRIRAAGIAAPRRAGAVLIDLAGDPPLGRSAHAIACEESERIVRALGAAMVASRADVGVVAVRGAEAERAVAAAIARVAAGEAGAARVARVGEEWPSAGLDRDLGLDRAWVLDGERALELEAAAFQAPAAPRRVTVAGAVARPGVIAVERGAPLTAAEAVERAGGPLDLGWVALDGGPLGGRLADEDAPLRSSLVWVTGRAHPLATRARVPLGDWLRRAASACEGCRACSDLCPAALDGAPLAPHEVIWTLVSGRDDGDKLAAAAACTGCGVCDLACPASLSPAALATAVRDRLPSAVASPARGAPHPDRAGRRASIALLAMRLGLPAADA